VLSIKTANDDRWLGDDSNTEGGAYNIVSDFFLFPTNNSNVVMKPSVATGAGVSGRSHIVVGMKVHISTKELFTSTGHYLAILLEWGVGTSPSSWNLLQGYVVPANTWALWIANTGHQPSWELSAEEILTGLSPSTTYTFRARINAPGSNTVRVQFPDATYPANRKFWALYYE